MLKVKLPDGSIREFSRRVRPIDVAAELGPETAKATLAAEADGRLVGVDWPLPGDGEITLRLLSDRDPEALHVMRHSCAHVMARAVMRLVDGVQLGFGRGIADRFYHDFAMADHLLEDDFPRIEGEMARIINQDEPFERLEEPRRRAIQLLSDLGQLLKVEHIREGLAGQERIALCRQGEFIDLCSGPHVPSAGAIGAYKLLSVTVAYWQDDASRQRLQRLHGTARFSREGEERHLKPAQGTV